MKKDGKYRFSHAQEGKTPARRGQADGIGQMLDNLGMFGQA